MVTSLCDLPPLPFPPLADIKAQDCQEIMQLKMELSEGNEEFIKIIYKHVN